MTVLFNALLCCVVFLTLFGMALWPVLFRESKRRKWIFAGANLTFLVMLLACGSSISRSRMELETRREQMKDALVIAADLLDKGGTVQAAMPDRETVENNDAEALEAVSRFVREIRKETAQ